MSVTWSQLLSSNAQFEHECLEQAKRELGLPLNCSLTDAMRVAVRAQQIKIDRISKGEKSHE